MKMRVGKSIVLKRNMKNLMSSLLPMIKKINKIKSSIMQKIRYIKKVSNNRRNNFSVKATKNMINTPKIDIVKSPIVVEPNVVTLSKIATKPKKVNKPKIVDKPKILIEKKH